MSGLKCSTNESARCFYSSSAEQACCIRDNSYLLLLYTSSTIQGEYCCYFHWSEALVWRSEDPLRHPNQKKSTGPLRLLRQKKKKKAVQRNCPFQDCYWLKQELFHSKRWKKVSGSTLLHQLSPPGFLNKIAQWLENDYHRYRPPKYHKCIIRGNF